MGSLDQVAIYFSKKKKRNKNVLGNVRDIHTRRRSKIGFRVTCNFGSDETNYFHVIADEVNKWR